MSLTPMALNLAQTTITIKGLGAPGYGLAAIGPGIGIGIVSIDVAGRVLGESLSADGTHSATVEGFLAELTAPPPTP